MYLLEQHGRMIDDEVRMKAFSTAIEQVVGEGDVVVDIGAGVGILSLLACRAGARRVYAIEPDPVLRLARELAAASGFGDRIVCIPRASEQAEVPEHADVIVSDLYGTLPLFQRRLAVLADARARFLAPGGRMIPEGETVWFVPLQADGSYCSLRRPWRDRDGLDMSPGWRRICSRLQRVDADDEPVELAPPAALFEIDHVAGAAIDQRARHTWEVDTPGTLHGLGGWFDARLTPGVTMHTGPPQPHTVYNRPLLLLPEPVEVRTGDRIVVELRARIVRGQTIWRWTTRVHRGDDTLARFDQSTFSGHPVLDEWLERASAEHVPRRNTEAEIDMQVLQLMAGELTNAEIAARLLQSHPEEFADATAALERVTALSGPYAR